MDKIRERDGLPACLWLLSNCGQSSWKRRSSSVSVIVICRGYIAPSGLAPRDENDTVVENLQHEVMFSGCLWLPCDTVKEGLRLSDGPLGCMWLSAVTVKEELQHLSVRWSPSCLWLPSDKVKEGLHLWSSKVYVIVIWYSKRWGRDGWGGGRGVHLWVRWISRMYVIVSWYSERGVTFVSEMVFQGVCGRHLTQWKRGYVKG